MTYARARLWLGISGVGSVVSIAAFAWAIGLPSQYFSTGQMFGVGELLQLCTVAGLFMLWLAPLDFLGGYLLPAKYQKSDQKLGEWLRGYVTAAFSQSLLFVIFGSLIVISSQAFGVFGGAALISLGIVTCFFVRNRFVLSRESKNIASDEKIQDAIDTIQTWQTFVPKTVVVKHKDRGFTGGIIGFGKHAQIVIPEAWLSFDREQLAVAIARRAVAINSGSYTMGLLFAFVWNACGFLLCSLIPGAELVSVAGLVTTVCGFTLWSFLGLLTLPTLSRNASLKIDQQLTKQGMPSELIRSAAFTMDQLQDGEPERPQFIEAIFHPVPNVTSRNRTEPVGGLAAWNVARTTLFFSWACLGFLSRSVHCNVGRPELWTMLPTD